MEHASDSHDLDNLLENYKVAHILARLFIGSIRVNRNRCEYYHFATFMNQRKKKKKSSCKSL